MSHRLRLFALAIALTAPFVAPRAALAGAPSIGPEPKVLVAHPSAEADGTLGPAARRALRQGYLVPDQRAYERAKRKAAKRAARARAFAVRPPLGAARLAPATSSSWTGAATDDFAPSDSTGAVGNSTFVELVNSAFAIYKKSSSTPISTGSLNGLAGVSSADTTFDVQVIWDPTTKRFYYALIDMASSADNNIAFGFSKSSSPDSGSSSDWCKYKIGFGAQFPDYPKLGDTKNFGLIGVNLFSGSIFRGAEALAFKKPPSGSSCPSPGALKLTSKGPLMTNSSTFAFTPVPANEMDSEGSGWIIARPTSTPSTKLAVFKVTKDSDTGKAKIQKSSVNISVPSYDEPPPAPQAGTTATLDTLDARFTQAVGAVDPNRNGKFAVWTQHTVAGGGGSKVSWFEVYPGGPKVLQKGSVANGSLYEFNGAISPNRAVSGSTQKGGANMLMNFNSSSSATFPDIRIVSKKGKNSQSGQVLVLASPGPLGGFDCSGQGGGGEADAATCRWGDYAAATPDPKDKSKIWNVSQWASGEQPTCPGLGCIATWRSQNFVASP